MKLWCMVETSKHMKMKLRFLNRLFKPVEQSFKKHFLKPARYRLRYELARSHRIILGAFGKICFIGITGSCGKTTTTELIASILSKQGNVKKGIHENTPNYHAKIVLDTSLRDNFCVCEISADTPGLMKKSLTLLKPRIGVVTNIGQDHYGRYRTLESTAIEKGKLIESLAAKRIAVLNADDPYVYEMRKRTKAQVITYGLSSNAIVRGECVSCAWPNPLSLNVCYLGEQIHVKTHLFGEHQVYNILAALTTGIAVGVSLENAVRAIEAVEPVPYRMNPHITADGVTFISDNWKAPLWSIPAAMKFMKTATAKRKIIVIGTISDTPKGFYHRYKTVINQVPDDVDKILFVGEHALSALRVKQNPDDEHIMAFCTLQALDSFLRDYLRPGDLVMLKGTENVDHLQRIVLSRIGEIACWRQKCGKYRFCEDCRLLHTPSTPSDYDNVKYLSQLLDAGKNL
jgi:UDP-N-acetylmuramoyl-tripeptide--D-alanyl-D-alanine ligase